MVVGLRTVVAVGPPHKFQGKSFKGAIDKFDLKAFFLSFKKKKKISFRKEKKTSLMVSVDVKQY